MTGEPETTLSLLLAVERDDPLLDEIVTFAIDRAAQRDLDVAAVSETRHKSGGIQ